MVYSQVPAVSKFPHTCERAAFVLLLSCSEVWMFLHITSEKCSTVVQDRPMWAPLQVLAHVPTFQNRQNHLHKHPWPAVIVRDQFLVRCSRALWVCCICSQCCSGPPRKMSGQKKRKLCAEYPCRPSLFRSLLPSTCSASLNLTDV